MAIEENPFQPYCYSNLNFLLQKWYQWLWATIDKHVPGTTKHRSKLQPWISSQTSHLMKQLGTLKRKREGFNVKLELNFAKAEKKLSEASLEDQKAFEAKVFKIDDSVRYRSI